MRRYVLRTVLAALVASMFGGVFLSFFAAATKPPREHPAWCHDPIDISKSALCSKTDREYNV